MPSSIGHSGARSQLTKSPAKRDLATRALGLPLTSLSRSQDVPHYSYNVAHNHKIAILADAGPASRHRENQSQYMDMLGELAEAAAAAADPPDASLPEAPPDADTTATVSAKRARKRTFVECAKERVEKAQAALDTAEGLIATIAAKDSAATSPRREKVPELPRPSMTCAPGSTRRKRFGEAASQGGRTTQPHPTFAPSHRRGA